MRSFLVAFALCLLHSFVYAQSQKTQLYDLLKKLLYDSTGYENVGDWAVGKPGTYPVTWKADRIEMSDDTSINFFRTGTADILIGGEAASAGKWSVMLRGARSGYSSFTMISEPSASLQAKTNVEDLLGRKDYQAKLMKSCKNADSGFYYYELKLPKKDVAFIKISWNSDNGKTVLRVDGYDSWSQYAVKLNCP